MKSVTKTLLGAACGMLFAFGAQAASVESQLFAGLNQLSDNSAEALIECTPGGLVNPTCTGSVAGRVDVGDRLRGIFTIETVEPLGGGSTNNLGGSSGNDELTGLFDITLVLKVDNCAIIPCPGNIGRFFYVFAPTASFAAEVGAPAGTAVAFYEDAAIEYSRLDPDCTVTGPGGDCETNIVNGSLLWAAGFGSADAFWVANAFTDDISDLGDAGSSSAGGVFNLGLDLLLNMGTKTLSHVDCGFPIGPTVLEFCGSGSLLGHDGANTPYDSFDNVDLTINVVPEPASIALTGLALLGIGAAARRRRQG